MKSSFFDRMISVLAKDWPLADFGDQIVREVLERTHANFVATLSSKENVSLWQKMITQEAIKSGSTLDDILGQVSQILPSFQSSYKLVEDRLEWIGDYMIGMNQDLDDIHKGVTKILDKLYPTDESLLNDLAHKSLDKTEAGKHLIEGGQSGQDTTSAIGMMPVAEHQVAGAIAAWEGKKELVYQQYQGTRDPDRFREFKEILARLVRLYAGTWTLDDLELPKIATGV